MSSRSRTAAALVVAGLASALAPHARGAQSSARWSRAKLELEGPLGDIRIRTPLCTTTLDARLAPGERRSLAIAVADSSKAGAPELDSSGSGSARFVAWDEAAGAATDAWWSALPPGLRARPRPVFGELAGDQQRAPPLALCLAIAALPLAFALRRRPLWCALGSLVFAAGVAAAVLTAQPERELVRVLEGDGAARRWFAVDVAHGELRVGADLAQRFESEPARAPAEIRARLDDPTLVLLAPRARLWRSLALDPGERSFARERNGWGDLAECWLREPDGEWSAHGPWAVGRALPAADPARPRDPPGWINPALPQGTGILIGRLESGAFAGDDARASQVWVRLIGLDAH